jgi:integrase
MYKRARYQNGCLTLERRKSGPDVWVFLWREFDESGKRRQRKITVGTVEEYPTESKAKKAVGKHRLEINNETPCGASFRMTVEQLVAHYREKELYNGNSPQPKARSTQDAYDCYLDGWILPRWQDYRLPSVSSVAVEEWLGRLKLTNGSKAKIRNVMSAIFTHAIRYEFIERNPITLVRQSAKRERIPDVLSVEETKALLSELQQPYLTLVALDAVTGLRRSELLGLTWADVDFDKAEINVTRGIVRQVVGNTKTEASRKPMPMEPELAYLLQDWKSRTAYNKPNDWVFASPDKKGTQPLWPENILRRYIRPAVEKCGIQKRVGYHTFRHSLATVMKANGEDVKTVQEILRHANSRITMDIYAQAVTPAKKQAQQKVLQMIRPSSLTAVSANSGR